MLHYLTLFLVFWAIIYTSARFLRYFRIVKDYKDQTVARVVRIQNHTPANRKEKPAVDVLLEYTIDGKAGRSEIIIPADAAEQYSVGNELDICYYVAGNGAVHIASAGDAPRKLMYGYLAAIVVELVVYAVIWRILL